MFNLKYFEIETVVWRFLKILNNKIKNYTCSLHTLKIGENQLEMIKVGQFQCNFLVDVYLTVFEKIFFVLLKLQGICLKMWI